MEPGQLRGAQLRIQPCLARTPDDQRAHRQRRLAGVGMGHEQGPFHALIGHPVWVIRGALWPVGQRMRRQLLRADRGQQVLHGPLAQPRIQRPQIAQLRAGIGRQRSLREHRPVANHHAGRASACFPPLAGPGMLDT